MDYFCADRSFPTQNPVALKEDIQVTITISTEVELKR
jgi:hypothetical protein